MPADGAEAHARRPIREDAPMEIIRTACPPRPVRTLSSRSLLAGDRTPRPKLRNVRRIVVVTTHGSSKLLNSLEGESGKRTVTRSIRAMCSRRTRTTWCALYGVDTCSEADRTSFLDRVESTLAKL